jgi:GH15 family glucan-1,4-alpha-glucosidase
VILAGGAGIFSTSGWRARATSNCSGRLEHFGERASVLWDRADSGPWEFRGVETAPHVLGAMCWAGCDRLQRIATELRLFERAQIWADTSARLRQRDRRCAWNPSRNAFTASFGGAEVDATSVLLPELGIVTGNDPRFLDTLDAVTQDLKHGDWLFRYRHRDDFGTPATAFTICAFWYVNALACAGRRDEARELFQRLLERRTSLGPARRGHRPVTGELWGNFPQTYSMVGIINCAVRLSRPWEDVL